MSKNQSYTKQTIKLYLNHAWQSPKLVIGILFSVPFAVLVSQFLPPLILANIIKSLSKADYIAGQTLQSFGPRIVLYVIIMFVGSFSWRLVDACVWRVEAKTLKSLADRVYNHLLKQSMSFHADSFGGSLVSQTNKLLGSYVRVADTTIFQVIPMICAIIFTSLIIFSKVPSFVFALLIFSIIYLGSAVYITGKVRVHATKHSEAESKQTGYLADSITNVLTIKSFSKSNFESKQFGKTSTNTSNKLLNLSKIVQRQMMYYSGMAGLVQSLALILSVIAAVEYNANIATVFLVLSYTSSISGQLFSFSTHSLRNYNRAFGDASEMTKILLLEQEVKDPASPEKLTIQSGRVTFSNAQFKHSGAKGAIFKNLNLDIKPGEKIGLVGHSGSGKTTLAKLVLRFIDLKEGSISIDGQDISSITQDDLRSKISFVPQEPLLFHRSLAENISYGYPSATQRELQAVAKMAHAHDFIKDLPEGYETLVGERGVKLSGGQRQRVAIARAMLKNAPILVLDEATSALDSESEALIQDALWRLMNNKTAIVIAHRLSTIQKMDRIIVLDNGKIIEEGTHKELIFKNGKYAKLWNRQSGGFIED